MCSNVTHSTELNATDSSRCNCESGYAWENGSCILNCANIRHSVWAKNGDCDCADGYSKTISNGTMACQLNCSIMTYSNK